MAKRRIVADTSVVAAGYGMPAHGAPRSTVARAQRVVDAVRSREVHAFAPERLVSEMLNVVYQRAFGRENAPRLTEDEAEVLAHDFLKLPIVYTGHSRPDAFGSIAWRIMRDNQISPSDSWFVTCARYYDAELWISHPHADGLLQAARRIHKRTFALSEQTFDASNV